jgi:hypothetical protein
MGRGSARTPKSWRRGQSLTAKRLDEPGAALRQILRGVASPRQIDPAGASLASEVRRFKITEVAHDYLQCVTWDGVTEGAVTYVAKPFLLRASALEREFSGGTLEFSNITTSGGERTATLGATVENQVVVPEYFAGDEITAIRNVKGKTGVTREEAGETKDIEWLDLNLDARAWAKEA